MADGERFYMSQENWRRGYSVPLDQLGDTWRIMQQSVPGSAMEHLMRLRGLPETELDATEAHPLRRGYQGERLYVVIACDPQGRLAQIEFFNDRSKKERTALYIYDDFVQVADGCWLAARHRAEVALDGETLRETRRFDNMQINQSIAPGIFDPKTYFERIEFTDSFEALESH